MSDQDRERRGAWRAGYDQGFKDGRESLSAEGWRPIAVATDVQEGDTVKLLTPTISGWTGSGTVLFVYSTGICFQKEGTSGPFEYVECKFHEAMVLRPYVQEPR